MNTAWIPIAIAAAFALACADGTLPARTANDPSNPRAPEAPATMEVVSSFPARVAPPAGGTYNAVAHAHHHATPATPPGSP